MVSLVTTHTPYCLITAIAAWVKLKVPSAVVGYFYSHRALSNSYYSSRVLICYHCTRLLLIMKVAPLDWAYDTQVILWSPYDNTDSPQATVPAIVIPSSASERLRQGNFRCFSVSIFFFFFFFFLLTVKTINATRTRSELGPATWIQITQLLPVPEWMLQTPNSETISSVLVSRRNYLLPAVHVFVSSARNQVRYAYPQPQVFGMKWSVLTGWNRP